MVCQTTAYFYHVLIDSVAVDKLYNNIIDSYNPRTTNITAERTFTIHVTSEVCLGCFS